MRFGRKKDSRNTRKIEKSLGTLLAPVEHLMARS
jgi:hypothetical protein